jgi:thioredoxin 1
MVLAIRSKSSKSRKKGLCEPVPYQQEFSISHMIHDIADREFDRIIENSSVPVLIEFWQPGCGHCQALLTELELLQAEVGDHLMICKMNVQENFLIPGELDIQSLPALALYVEKNFEKFIGGIGKKRELLTQLYPWIDPSP